MIQQDEYRQRRKQLMRIAGEDAVVILPASPERFRNSDVTYPYRQNSDFYYLTGFAEPDALLVLRPGDGDGEAILFCRRKDPDKEIWDGPMAGQQGAIDDFGMDRALDIAELDDQLPALLTGRERVFYTFGLDIDFDHHLMSCINELRQHSATRRAAPAEYVSLDHFLHDMRLYKSRKEMSCLSTSARVAVAAHERAMRVCQPGMHEYELAAELHHEFNRAHCSAAYQPIVGSGVNSCVLHYVSNGARMRDGDLVLIDAGAEYDGYASDITRTFPVNGRFSSEQRAIYEVVLRAQKAAIETIRPGSDWEAPHEAAARVIAEGLIDLGLMTQSLDDVLAEESYRHFFMHKTGHWLGLDVHDVGDYQVDNEPRMLESGMVMTVEPGIYISPQDQTVEPRWRGIGVRIEDDVAVTPKGHRVLSRQLVREVDDIEALMAS